MWWGVEGVEGAEECGGVVGCGGMWWSVVGCGGVTTRQNGWRSESWNIKKTKLYLKEGVFLN